MVDQLQAVGCGLGKGFLFVIVQWLLVTLLARVDFLCDYWLPGLPTRSLLHCYRILHRATVLVLILQTALGLAGFTLAATSTAVLVHWAEAHRAESSWPLILTMVLGQLLLQTLSLTALVITLVAQHTYRERVDYHEETLAHGRSFYPNDPNRR